jgi:hypothetical protein
LEGQTCLLSGGAPDSPMHHRTVTVVVRCAIAFQIRRIRPLVLGVDWRTGQSGAHRTVRCAQPTVAAGHASPVDCVADRCAGDRWLTRQSGAPPDGPVNYSRTPSSNPESGEFTADQPGCNALNLGGRIFSSFLSPNSGVTLFFFFSFPR